MRRRQLGLWLFTLVVLSACAAGGFGAEKLDDAHPAAPFGVPDDEACARALKLVKQTFAGDYAAAQTLPLRAALAQRLLREAVETRDDKAARYVLLCEARDLAAKGADAATACRAIDLLAGQFGVGPSEMTLAALSNIARVALTPQSQEALVHCAMAAADGAVARDDYDMAARLAALAEGAAKKSQRVVLVTDAGEKVKEIAWAAGQFKEARDAIEALATRPNDADAKSAAGRYKCLVKNDWEHGLPLLAEGSDAALKLLAERDQAAVTAGAEAQYQVGEQWWELGEKYLQRARLACRSRAAYWYKRAAPKLMGLSRSNALKRVEEVDLARLRERQLEPGLVAEFFEGQEFKKFLQRRVDGRIDFEWPGAPGDGLPKDDFSVRWTGLLRAPATGRYVLGLTVNEGAKVWVDDRLVIEELKGTGKRKPTQATVSLEEGMHSFKVEFWDGGGLARVRLSWQVPGAGSEEIIPEKAFVHERGTERP
jgi:hypothetical protein